MAAKAGKGYKMNKSSLLTQLAIAGIAAGLVSISPAFALEEMKADTSKAAVSDTSKPVKKKKKAKKAVMADSTAKADTSKTMPMMADTAKVKMGGGKMMHDSTMQKHMQDSMMHGKSGMVKEKHSCKGQNSCKGMGGCKMSQAECDAAHKKMGKPLVTMAKENSCKGKNDCKGMGGCSTI